MLRDQSLYEGFIEDRNATFQQYSVVPARIAAKIPSNLSFDQAASLPGGVITAALGLYDTRPGLGAGLVAPWEEGGRGKYAGQPIVVIGGSSSVGQCGELLHAYYLT